MAIKQAVSLTTLPTANEQTGVSPLTVTVTGISRQYPELGSYYRAIFFLDVSAVAGTNPTLDVVIQVQDPQSLKWSQLFAFAQQTTTTGATPLTPSTQELYGLNYRAAWTIGGTNSPSFTFSLCAVVGVQEPF